MVIPVFVILFGGMLFMHHVIREQQRVGEKSKADAWTSAMASCGGGGADVPQLPFSSTMNGAPGSDITLQDNTGSTSSSASNTVTVSLDGSGGGGGGYTFSQAVSAKATVFCNNQTQPGDLGGVFKWIFNNVKSLL